MPPQLMRVLERVTRPVVAFGLKRIVANELPKRVSASSATPAHACDEAHFAGSASQSRTFCARRGVR